MRMPPLSPLTPRPPPPRFFRRTAASVWGTGQDQMRIIKQRLLEMMPAVRVFLDVSPTPPLPLDASITHTTLRLRHPYHSTPPPPIPLYASATHNHSTRAHTRAKAS